jgi:glucokinase
MTSPESPSPSRCAIGIDVGGTKCAAGLIAFPEGQVLARRWQPTGAERGGDAVLSDVVDLATSLRHEASDLNVQPTAIGVAVAELVSILGRVCSQATIHWKDIPVAESLGTKTGLPVIVEADVRAAARGEAQLGGGRGLHSFLYISIGTGISACLVIDGVPYAGARGLTGTFASSRGLFPTDDGSVEASVALEEFASGRALASRYTSANPAFGGSTREVLALAAAGDTVAERIVGSAAQAAGSAVGQLVNMLDPEAVILGGGLGAAPGRYRDVLESAMREQIWSDDHRDLMVQSAELGDDAGFIGAALASLDR